MTNAGPSNAAVVEVLDALPGGLDVAGAQWLCIAGGTGTSCGSAASGSGDVAIDDAVVPVGGTLTVIVSATATAPPDTVVTNVAMVNAVSGLDAVTANDADDASVTVGDDTGPPADALFQRRLRGRGPVGSRAEAKTVTLDAGAIAAGTLHEAATLVTADGDEVGRLDAMPHAQGIAWRVRRVDADGVERASAWLDAPVLGPYVGAVRVARGAAGITLAGTGHGCDGGGRTGALTGASSANEKGRPRGRPFSLRAKARRAAAGGEPGFTPGSPLPTRPGTPMSATDLLEVEEAAQLLRAARMAQLAQRLGLDLADALAGDVELLADFFQRVVGVHVDAEAHAQHLGLARRQAGEHVAHGFAQADVRWRSRSATRRWCPR